MSENSIDWVISGFNPWAEKFSVFFFYLGNITSLQVKSGGYYCHFNHTHSTQCFAKDCGATWKIKHSAGSATLMWTHITTQNTTRCCRCIKCGTFRHKTTDRQSVKSAWIYVQCADYFYVCCCLTVVWMPAGRNSFPSWQYCFTLFTDPAHKVHKYDTLQIRLHNTVCFEYTCMILQRTEK